VPSEAQHKIKENDNNRTMQKDFKQQGKEV
jgi:hypothetical protein